MWKAPSWEAEGDVIEKRELRTKADNTVWAYEVLVECRGATLPLQTKDQAIYDKVGVGETVRATGRFQESQGKFRLTVTGFAPLKENSKAA